MSSTDQPALHDAYGFRLDCSTEQLEARHHCDQAQSQLSAKWDKLQNKMRDSKDSAKDAKLKKYCRQVIFGLACPLCFAYANVEDS